MQKKPNVLFVCTGNAGRSQMAQAICRSLYADRIEVYSAGVDPWPDLHPMARKLMAEREISLEGHYTKDAEAFGASEIDVVVTIGDRALNECPEFAAAPKRIHWEISDPADADGTPDSETTFRHALAEIERRLEPFVQDLLAGE